MRTAVAFSSTLAVAALCPSSGEYYIAAVLVGLFCFETEEGSTAGWDKEQRVRSNSSILP
jgi:hypothetical protein